MKQIAARGTQYLRHVVITWSMRRRGKVQRTHIITVTPKVALPRKLTTPAVRAMYHIHQSEPLGLGSASEYCPFSKADVVKIGIGPFQPPKNRIAARPLTRNIEPYSAMK